LDKFVIIVAGGTGTRMGSEVPKQFLPLAGQPVLMHTIRAFRDAVPEAAITVALPAGEFERWSVFQEKHGFDIGHSVVAGGPTRFHSVLNALSTLPENGLVAIHDGARPLVQASLIQRCFREAEKSGNAVPAIPVKESMRFIEGNENHPADRSAFLLIQTPQVFRVSEIKAAYMQEYREDFTDDATVLESAGHPIHLVEGETRNIKITGPDDLAAAQALISLPFQR
jgi:2-C-methyl-D-erythritol 4-phosphate cytidylyltransferase